MLKHDRIPRLSDNAWVDLLFGDNDVQRAVSPEIAHHRNAALERKDEQEQDPQPSQDDRHDRAVPDTCDPHTKGDGDQ